MSAPKGFNIPAPVIATEVPPKRDMPTRAKKDRGPNLFLDNGWLQESFDDGQWRDVPVDGEWTIGTLTKGAHKGEEVERLTGTAQEVTRQLREAATVLGIGVSIKYFPVLYQRGDKKGQEVPGKVLVKYVGTKRKAPRAGSAES